MGQGASTAGASDDCSYIWGVTNNSSAVLTLTTSVHLKKGPAAECGNVRWAGSGTELYAWCWTANSYGRQWIWARIKGTETALYS